jgi:hypothetical protein
MTRIKKLSEYGITLLDELEKDRTKFRDGSMKVKTARAIATMANATSGALRTSLNCKKFELEFKI